MDKKDKSSKKILSKLKKGEVKLYFGEGCPACEDQIVHKLKSSYGKIRKLKGGKDVIKHKNPDIQGVPTWVNKFGDHIVGSYDPKTLLKKLETKQKRSVSFGKSKGFKVYSELNQQPQFMNHTKYGGRRGGMLECDSENIGTWSKNLKSFNKNKKPLGVFKLNYGGLLPRPYGPSDNLKMKSTHLAGSKLEPLPLSWNYQLGQFGKRKNRRSVKKRNRRKTKRLSKRRSKRIKRRSIKKFGSTPGSKSWTKSVKNIKLGSEWVNPKLAPAKGYNLDPVLLYLPVKNKYKAPEFLNVPKQFSNNQYNDPHPSSLVHKFGSGQYPSLIQMEGPNNVAYQKGMNLYPSAGANTVNWTTGRDFRKSAKPTLKVQKTKNNPRSWISNTKGIKKASGGFNKARSYTHKGIRNFGEVDYNELAYTRDMVQGAKTLYQPLPPYMAEKVRGDYATNKQFGTSHRRNKLKKQRSIRKVKKRSRVKHKKLQTQFGGKTITLDSKGKITISANTGH
jgi:hypothetical protein